MPASTVYEHALPAKKGSRFRSADCVEDQPQHQIAHDIEKTEVA